MLREASAVASFTSDAVEAVGDDFKKVMICDMKEKWRFIAVDVNDAKSLQ